MPAPTWPSLTENKIEPNLEVVVKRVEVVLDHADILTLNEWLELKSTQAGIAYVKQALALSHPVWTTPYEGGDDITLIVDGVQSLSMGVADQFGEDAALKVVTPSAGANSYIDEVGQPLRVRVVIPVGGLLAVGFVSGTPPEDFPLSSYSPTSTSGSGNLDNVSMQISAVDDEYVIGDITSPSFGFEVGDTITFSGAIVFGGASPANDLVLEVTEVISGLLSGGQEGQQLKIAVDYTERAL